MNAIAIALHVIAAVLWVGGMFFAYLILRPTAATYDPRRRLTLWAGVFKRFFPWVWMSVFVLLISGYWMMFGIFRGFANSPVYVHIMQLLGLLMIALFVYLYYWPYAVFKKNVLREDWPAAGAGLNRIRQIILINLCLGLLVVVCASAGRYF